jgi:hypothetical protein
MHLDHLQGVFTLYCVKVTHLLKLLMCIYIYIYIYYMQPRNNNFHSMFIENQQMHQKDHVIVCHLDRKFIMPEENRVTLHDLISSLFYVIHMTLAKKLAVCETYGTVLSGNDVS